MGGVKTCDLCDSTENLAPIYDPWGMVFAYMCETCNDKQAEAATDSSRTTWDDFKNAQRDMMRHFGVRS